MRLFRYLGYAVMVAFAIVLITLALANRDAVTLSTLPEGVAMGVADMPALSWLAVSVEVPLFLVIFAGVVAGLLVGFVWEWLREHKYRAQVAQRKAEVKSLERQLKKTQNERDKDKDEVLAILDQAS